MSSLVTELKARVEGVAQGGGEKAVARHKSKGKEEKEEEEEEKEEEEE